MGLASIARDVGDFAGRKGRGSVAVLAMLGRFDPCLRLPRLMLSPTRQVRHGGRVTYRWDETTGIGRNPAVAISGVELLADRGRHLEKFRKCRVKICKVLRR